MLHNVCKLTVHLPKSSKFSKNNSLVRQKNALASFNLAHHLAITFERETKLASEVTIDADCNVNDNRTLLSKVKAFDTRQNRAMSIRKQSSLKKITSHWPSGRYFVFFVKMQATFVKCQLAHSFISACGHMLPSIRQTWKYLSCNFQF